MECTDTNHTTTTWCISMDIRTTSMWNQSSSSSRQSWFNEHCRPWSTGTPKTYEVGSSLYTITSNKTFRWVYCSGDDYDDYNNNTYSSDDDYDDYNNNTYIPPPLPIIILTFIVYHYFQQNI